MAVRFLVRALGNAAALWLAGAVVPGVTLRGLGPDLAAGLVLGLINALAWPLLFRLTFWLTLLTQGLFVLVLNAACLALAAWLVPGFEIEGPLAAGLAALLVSAVGWVLTRLLGDDREAALRRRDRPPR